LSSRRLSRTHAVGPGSSPKSRGAKRWSPPSPAGFELCRRKTRRDGGFHLGQLNRFSLGALPVRLRSESRACLR
jgi:hypothetical protein